MTVLLLIVCWLALPTPVSHDDEWVVTFRMQSPDLAEDTTVYITGGLTSLGNWRPNAVPMTYAGDHVWTLELTVDREQTIEYKYTLGSWDREGAGADGLPLENLTVTVNRSLVQDDQILFWTSGQQRPIRGQITGTVKYHRELEGAGLRPRDVIVWLPPDYDDNDDARYPVLYMHDGQNIVDPATSSFGVDWAIDETLTELIAEGKLPAMIVVGIYNTPDRGREYVPGSKGDRYETFIIDTLKPLIDRTYRTRPERDHTWVGGASLGGLSAFMLTWENPHVFSKAICMSPAFQYKRGDGTLALDYVSTVIDAPLPEPPVTVYVDNGGVGLDKNLQPGVDAMLEALRDKGLTEGEDFHWVFGAEDRHGEAAWAKRLPGALLLLTAGQ
ncbi:MAG: alpha/beta hydrolase-fold protein [Pirellulaceae bacterium]